MFLIDVGIDSIQDLLNMDEAAKKAVQKAGMELAAATHAHAVEEAAKKLRTRRQMFVDGLTFSQEGDDTFVVSLDASVRWVDDGLDPHDMKPDLLKSPKAKTSKDGVKYLSVPFQHNKGPTESTPAQQNLLDTIKKALKDVKAPYGNLETNAQGDPKLGLVRSMDIMQRPTKTHEGAGQGRGPVGQVVQGPTGIPLLQGVRVFQQRVKTKQGPSPSKGDDDTTQVKKFIMTFRTVTSEQGGDRWQHPGLAPVHIMEDSADWALQEWDRIAPKLVQQVMMEISGR